MCFPLCTVMGLTNCTCPPEDECRVCCVGEDRLCSPLPEVSLSDSSPCQQGVCIDVSLLQFLVPCILLHTPLSLPPSPILNFFQGMCSSQTQDVITRFWTIIITLNTSAFSKCGNWWRDIISVWAGQWQGVGRAVCSNLFVLFFTIGQLIDENIVGFTLIFSIPIWCLGSCLLHWLVSKEHNNIIII